MLTILVVKSMIVGQQGKMILSGPVRGLVDFGQRPRVQRLNESRCTVGENHGWAE
jgi:hypothetical protein